MSDHPPSPFNRRTFICFFSAWMAGSAVRLTGSIREVNPIEAPRLWTPFNPEEKQAINKSRMAQSIIQYPRKKYNCAESLLLASLDYLKRPKEWATPAGGFGGGLGYRDLCGLLTAGIMAIGLASGVYHRDREKFQSFIKERRREYWQWWQARAPIHCREMRGQYDRPGFYRMIQRVAARLEALIAPEKS